MKNLSKLLKAQILKGKKEKLEAINKIDFCNASKLDWYLSNMLPKSKEKFIFNSPKELKDYLKKRLEVYADKKINQLNSELVFSENLQPINEITIAVEWKKSQMWGLNPTAESFVVGLGRLSSGSIGGCGYDKQSTAVANVLNQIPQFKKLMFELKNKKYKLSNRELFGYGSGSGILPCFEGGVGVSCYDRIFNSIGYKFETVSSGKTFDVYKISKVSQKVQKEKIAKLYNYKD